MPLRLVRAHAAHVLWHACVHRFLADAEASPGPSGHPAWIWLSHRNLRDLLYEEAHARGVRGWLRPPVTLVGDLADLFEIRETAAGLLTRRRMLSRIAADAGHEVLGRDTGLGRGLVRAHMLDALFADLLPEGVGSDELEEALDLLPADPFTTVRNRWIVEVYRRYLAGLSAEELVDWRSVRARITERIEEGALSDVLGGARTLHIYGLANPRTFRRLLVALAAQHAVEVVLYQPLEPEADELEPLADRVEELTTSGAGPETLGGPAAGDGTGGCAVSPTELSVAVQPAPDAAREMDWVARRVKMLLNAGVEPHRVAVVARTGREDTLRVCRSLERAGAPCTARTRTPLAQIAALKALLTVFHASARGWDYGSFRALLDHPYFDTDVDLRSVDFLAGERRIRGLAAWEVRLERLRASVEEEDRSTWGAGLFADRIEKDLTAFRRLRETLEPLSEPRPEGAWIELTRRFLREDRGLFSFRRRVCDAADERWDVVRQDQRGIVQLERLLAEWQELDHPEEPLTAEAWHGLLRRMLEANELVLSTPLQKGVQVLEAHDAALVPFEHTFLVHANDGEFPRAPRSSGVLADEERARLFAAGLPLAHRDEALRRERRLWRSVIQQAGDVHVSYRTTDAAGTPLLPSLMVEEHDVAEELPRTRRPGGEATPVSEAEADRHAADLVHHALGRNCASAEEGVPVAPARPEALKHAIVAAVAEWHRGAGRERAQDRDAHVSLRPNPWNGEWRDPELLAWLEDEYSPEYRWSAGQLEQYGRAPFLFLVDRVLGLSELTEAEEETTPLAFGGITHTIMERFYREVKDDLPGRLDEATSERLDRIVTAVCRERQEKGEWLGLPAIWGATREQVRRKVRAYVKWELPYMAAKGEWPRYVELGFGFDEPVYIEGTDVHGDPARLRIRGRMDRVDRAGAPDDEGAALHVLDYKSSSVPSRGGHLDGSTLQGALYLRVLRDRGLPADRARYRVIKSPGDPGNGCLVIAGSKYYQAAIPLALSMPARVRAGLFEPVRAGKVKWMPWDPGLQIRRNDAGLNGRTRLDVDGGEEEG